MAETKLFENIDFADVQSVLESEEFTSRGGSYVLIVRADDYDGALIEIQVAGAGDPNLRFSTLDNGSFTEDSTVKMDYLPNSTKVKAVLSGAGPGLSNLFVGIAQ